MANTHEGYLAIPQLPKAACKAYLFKDMQSSLISVGQLCDSGCIALFNQHDVSVLFNKQVILQGKRDISTGMWNVELPTQKPASSQPPDPNAIQHTAQSAIAAETLGERIAFLHACAGSPAISTFRKAIQAGFYTTWPELTAERVDKYLVTPAATVQGHLDQQRKNIRSTKPKAKPKATTPFQFPGDTECPLDVQPENSEERCNQVFLTCMPLTGQIFSDQPGQFLVSSTSGMSYLMIAHCYDSNAIIAEPMPSKTGNSLLNAYTKIHTKLTARGFRPKYQRLDNEISTIFQAFLKQEGIDYQLTPADSHRRNAAKRAIRTWKNHFIAMLCSTDPEFPLKLWDRLLEQAEITLNLLRASRVNPKLSAYAQLFGPFDFNRTPLGPPGTRVLVHELPTARGTWSPHAVHGYYTGPATDHYRCYKVWIAETSSERIANTLVWHPTRVTMPRTSSADAATAAARTLIHALKNPHPASPLSPLTDEHQSALQQLAEVFAAQVPEAPSVTPDAPAALPRVSSKETPVVPTPGPTELAWTYVQRTRNRGQARRAKQKAQRATAPTSPPSTSATATVPKSAPPRQRPSTRAATVPKRAPPRDRHNTRAQRAQRRQAANSTTAPPQPNNNVHRQHFVNALTTPETGDTLEWKHVIKGPNAAQWRQGNLNEIGRLTDGRIGKNIVATNTIRFIKLSALPAGRQPTYLRVVVSYRPQKEDPYRIRWTVGGNRIDYPGEKSTPGSDQTTVKLLTNSVISTPDARWMCIDIKDFYLNTEMDRPEYMWISVNMLGDEVIAAYNLKDHIVNGRVLVEINKGMYGLPQAGRLAYDKLVTKLAPHGYIPCPRTPGLWKHIIRPVTFCLVVDDFGVKYVGRQHADHLLHALLSEYKVTTDWGGTLYLGITFKWDYQHGTVDLSMPGYIERALKKFKHPKPYRPEHAPYDWTVPVYGRHTQLAAAEDESPLLDATEKQRVQAIVGTTLFYARAVDPTALVALGSISSEQSNATEKTNKKVTRLLNYFATNPNATIRYHKSEMCLTLHTDASYLCEPKARSRVGGHFFLSDMPTDPNHTPLASDPAPPNNGPVKTNSNIMKFVLASASEAETGGMFYNCQDAVSLRTTLAEIGHPQPATRVRGDNSTAIGIANKKIKQRRSKAIDMRFYWLQDREAQSQFKFYWDKGDGNLADYFTKHHSVTHHRAMRPVYLLPGT